MIWIGFGVVLGYVGYTLMALHEFGRALETLTARLAKLESPPAQAQRTAVIQQLADDLRTRRRIP